MVNYANAKIYKIVDNTNGKIYVGSTCKQYLSSRLAGHVGNYKLYLQGTYNFVTSFEIIKNEDYDMILIEHVNCTTKDQLHERERYYIETLDCVNKSVPGRMKKEYQKQYQKDKKDQIQQYKQQYQITNKDRIQQYQNEKYSCKCGGKFTSVNKMRHLKSIKHQKYEKMNQQYHEILEMEEQRLLRRKLIEEQVRELQI